jgi:predicted  nucleic acid-binding Zn-ribbon protein
MMNALKKVFNNSAKATSIAEVEQQMESLEMSKPVADTAQLEALASSLSAAEASMASQAVVLAELTSKFDSVVAELSSVKEAKAQLEATMKAAKFATRKEKIEMAVGTSKADALFAATEALEDVQFEAVIGAMTVNLEAEAKTPAFQEQGIGHGVDATKVVQDPAVKLAEVLKAKYHKTK